MQIKGKQWQILTETLTQFQLSKLDHMLRFELNQDREAIALGNDKTDIVFRVIEHYNFRDQVELLVMAARRYVPTNRQLQLVAQEFGIATQVSTATYDATGQLTQSSVQPLRLERTVRSIFQKTVRSDNPKLDASNWAKKLAEMEHRICRIERADNPAKGVGTGFLVGEEAILTNYHVVKPHLNEAGELEPGRLRVRFDYSIAPDGVSLPPGVTYLVSEMADSSLPSLMDERPFPPSDPSTDELDYALLILDSDAGNEPIGGERMLAPGEQGPMPRGYISMPTTAYAFKNDAPLLIYQHPEGGPLKLAIETNAIESLNGNRTRALYRTNTESGSSGSPCFDMDWNLVALHHASTYSSGGVVNRGIPIDMIQKRLQERNVAYYLGDGS